MEFLPLDTKDWGIFQLLCRPVCSFFFLPFFWFLIFFTLSFVDDGNFNVVYLYEVNCKSEKKGKYCSWCWMENEKEHNSECAIHFTVSLYSEFLNAILLLKSGAIKYADKIFAKVLVVLWLVNSFCATSVKFTAVTSVCSKNILIIEIKNAVVLVLFVPILVNDQLPCGLQ